MLPFRPQGVRHHGRMKLPVLPQTLLPSFAGGGLLAFQEQQRRSFGFLEQHNRLMASALGSPLNVTLEQHRRLMATAIRSPLKDLEQFTRVKTPGVLANTVQTQMKLLRNPLSHPVTARAVQMSLLSKMPPTVKAAYVESLATTSPAFAALRALPDPGAAIGMGSSVFAQLRATMALVGDAGLPRSVTRWMQDSPIMYAAGLWEQKLQDLQVAPDATPADVAAATTAAGVAALQALADTITYTLDAHQATTADQISGAERRLGDRLDALEARLEAADRQQRRWLLKPDFLVQVFLSLLLALNTPNIVDGLMAREVAMETHIQQVTVRFGQSLERLAAALAPQAPELYEVGPRAVPLHVRPHGPSRVTRVFSPATRVLVQARRGKWVQVAVYDPRANQPVTGWCLKKYLHRTKAK